MVVAKMIDYDILWKGDWISVISPKKYPYECLGEGNGVLVIPTKDGKIGVRKELCPPYLVMDTTGYEKYYTLITGMVDDGEEPHDAMERELTEESGVVAKEYEQIDFPAIPIFKNLANRIYIYLIDITSYEEVEITGDGTEYEANSETLWLTKDEIAEIVLNEQNYDMLFLMLYFITLSDRF